LAFRDFLVPKPQTGVADQIRRIWKVPMFANHWLDLDAREHPIFSDEGRLYRWNDFPDGAPVEIIDLNPNKFEAIPPPPWAKDW
jgi:hypothetical protein